MNSNNNPSLNVEHSTQNSAQCAAIQPQEFFDGMRSRLDSFIGQINAIHAAEAQAATIQSLDLNSTSFTEAFPNYLANATLETQNISTNLEFNQQFTQEVPEIVQKLIEEKGLVVYLNLFGSQVKNSNINPNELMDTLLKQSESKFTESLQNKPLGTLGEYTLNQALIEGFKFIKPLKENLDKGLEISGLDVSLCGQLVSFLFMFNTICKGHASIIKRYSPSKTSYDKLSLREKAQLEELWVKNHTRFKLIAAPLLVISLYAIKKAVNTPQIKVSVDLNTVIDPTNNNSINKSLPLLVLFKKLPDFIGKIVIFICITSLIKYLFDINSINLMDSYYIKLFCLFGLLVSSILALDYLFQILIYFYLKKNKNIIISNKFPNIIYKYLTTLKILSEIDNFDYRYFIIYFVIYLFILLLLITLLIIL